MAEKRKPTGSAAALRLAPDGVTRRRVSDGRSSRPGPEQGDPRAEAAAEEARLIADLEAELTPDDRAGALSDAAKDTARLLGMQIARRIMMLGHSTLSDLQERTGIDAATISRIANGRRASGPQLWTLLALADAAGLKLRVSVAEG